VDLGLRRHCLLFPIQHIPLGCAELETDGTLKTQHENYRAFERCCKNDLYIVRLWVCSICRGKKNNYHCIRVPEGDPRIPELTKQHKPSWDIFVNYPYAPTTKEELFRLQTPFKNNLMDSI
jgi:hypothetical protein